MVYNLRFVSIGFTKCVDGDKFVYVIVVVIYVETINDLFYAN